ncbi:MAG TPA: TSUP family transporter [Pseudonocardia sp.]|uniref:TSUP family transporter n=1 Tax=Pseudonocardia sp. TaxID=60912 RepID=UPI002C2E317D|nr:TSUP family transporter [Pseudonocardia sp.]HTF51216.1 TSUP family transporter [Pseudonocardia sp.]
MTYGGSKSWRHTQTCRWSLGSGPSGCEAGPGIVSGDEPGPALVCLTQPHGWGGGRGTIGAALLLLTSADLFAWIVPFLIALASSLLLVQPKISTWRQERHRPENPALALAAMFVVSIYGGYFGAGAGGC